MKIPSATYRLQLNSEFNFDKANQIVEYLESLGITDIYASPIFAAKAGSSHGYDVIDPTRINPELGGEEGFNKLNDYLKSKAMGWIQDIVPNHMAFDSQNQWLMDIFENGKFSKYFNCFDIDWDHHEENLKSKLLAPFLGEFYGTCIDQAKIQIHFDENGFKVHYYEWQFPLNLNSYTKILSMDIESLASQLGRDHADFQKLLELTDLLTKLDQIDNSPERYRQITYIKSLLWKLYQSNDQIKSHVDRCVILLNGHKENLDTFDLLDDLLCEQFFRLAFWKVGNEELNYRRFFTVSHLMCLCMDNENVFSLTHRLIQQYVKENKFTGLRIDHLDGQYDPLLYLRRLKEKMPDTYIIAEKILDLNENLQNVLSIHGTTGYDFLNFVNSIFVDSSNLKKFDKIYTQFTGINQTYHEMVCAKKRLFTGRHMAGDIDNLAHQLKSILSFNRYGRDMTLYGLRRALVDIMAQFPVYRTYITADQSIDADIFYVKEAAVRAKNQNPGLIYEIEFIERVLLLDFGADIKEEEKVQWVHFCKRFQQFTGPLMAKGAEDTTFYIYNRLISLNEVGGNPDEFGITQKAFHDFNTRRHESWPHTMNATATHDTKRGEDVRARINVLSEIPSDWNMHLKKWNKLNKSKKQIVDRKHRCPDKNDEYFIYQTLLGTYPFSDQDQNEFLKRMQEYVVKAIREAKIHTAWIKPDFKYEEACANFVEQLLETDSQNTFLESFLPFQKIISFFGIFNSLSQLLLKITCPGFPDIYQGTELWDLSLVDPDNRRPVDYECRAKALEGIKSGIESNIDKLIEKLLNHKEDGRLKMFLLHRLLTARQTMPDLFQKGQYVPLIVEGEHKNCVIAFARQLPDSVSIAIAPRYFTKLVGEGSMPLGEIWKDTMLELPDNFPNEWMNAITSQRISCLNGCLFLKDVLNLFPVGLLTANT